MSNKKQMVQVPVSGGDLTVARWGSGATTVLALHGITANHANFLFLAKELAADDVTILAPDLRGRGDSGELPGPFGYQQHIDDLLAVLDHFGVAEAVVVGHSMGGMIATKMALRHADRMSSLVLVDGGPALPLPAGLDPDVVLAAVLGPAMERLEMTFEGRGQYHDYWRAHPALVDDWSPELEAYFDHDLHEVDGSWRSKVNAAAIRTDGRVPLEDPDLLDALDRIERPIRFLWAHRGIMGGDPLYPREVLAALEERVANLDVTWVEDANHYTVALSEVGAKHIAGAVRSAIEGLA